MKTLLFTLEFPPYKGGVSNVYGNLAAYWPIGENLTVLNNNDQSLLKPGKFLSWLPAFGILKRKIIKNNIEYVLVGQILPLGTLTWFLSLFRPLKYAVYLHGMDLTFALKSPRKRILTYLILKRADKIISVNSCVARKIGEFIPEFANKTEVINPGIVSGAPFIKESELVSLNELYNIKDKIVLLSIGRLVKRKGFDMVLRALSELPEAEINNLVYFIAGIGADEQYLRLLVPDKLKKQIIFLGKITDEEKWVFLKRCDLFIMPSREIEGDFEGFGIVYLEANLSGKPVIAGESGGVGDAVIDGYNGLLVNPEDVFSIQGAITRLISDPILRNKLGEQGRTRAINEFNWEEQVSKLINAIKK